MSVIKYNKNKQLSNLAALCYIIHHRKTIANVPHALCFPQVDFAILKIMNILH